MSMPFYVSPEQLMRDRADYARKGIARGRSLVVIQFADGLLFVAENQSQTLHKVSELYDKLAFAAVGRYNEFENLRIAGVRLADMRGYSYDRLDVTGRGLANAYAQTLGTIFSSGGEKPYEVELFVAELGDRAEDDQIYRLTYQGSVADEQQYAAMGGSAEQVGQYLEQHYEADLDLDAALRLAVAALGHDDAEPRQITPDALEAAALERSRPQPRKFRRISADYLTELLGVAEATVEPTDEANEDPAAQPNADSEDTAKPDDAATPDAATPDDATTDDGAADSDKSPPQTAQTPGPTGSPRVAGEVDPAPIDPDDQIGDLPDDPDATR